VKKRILESLHKSGLLIFSKPYMHMIIECGHELMAEVIKFLNYRQKNIVP
jgi:hypothetical protein